MNMAMSEREIFLTAVEKPDPTARAEYLDQVCGGNAPLRQKVEALLEASVSAGDFLEQPPVGMALTIQTGQLDTVSQTLGSVSLDFLQPSSKAGCLGTLAQYEVVGVVGRGAFGIVLRAYDTKLNRIVAIKVMAPELATNPMAVKRFLREAQAAAAVRHDHIVTIHAIQEEASPPFIVMEYVEGQSLKERVDESGALELTEILQIGMQMAAGLTAAHGQGLVHRDIKPANILLENGIKRVKITDFGLARAVDDVGMTQTGVIAGTPTYMSPEQGLGRAVDARSDLFSLGSVLYTLCTGRPPFRADSAVATLRRVCDDAPRSMREIDPQIPEWLENIVMRLLEKQADARFQSAEEVTQVLGSCLAHVQSQGSVTPLPASHLASLLGSPTQRPDRLQRRSKAVKTFVIGGTLLMIAIVGSVIAACLEVETIIFTGPVFGVALGAVVAIAGFLARLSWKCIGFGLSSIGISALVTMVITICNLGPSDPTPIVSMLIVYACFAVPWGYQAVKHARVGEHSDVSFRWVWKSRRTFLIVFAMQLIGWAAAAVNATIELESIFVTVPLFGGLFAVWLLVFTFTGIARETWTRYFALLAPTMCVTVFAVALCLQFFGIVQGNLSPQRVVSTLIVLFSFLALPVGLVAFARELRIPLTGNSLRPRFTIKSALGVTALCAASFAAAQPCLAFGATSFMAGSLLATTLLSLPLMLGYAWYKKESRVTPMRWLGMGMGIVTGLLLLIFGGLVTTYDRQTAFGAANIWSKQPVTLRFEDVDSGRVSQFQVDTDGLLLTRIPLGTHRVTVLGKDDLKHEQDTVKITRYVVPPIKIVKKEYADFKAEE